MGLNTGMRFNQLVKAPNQTAAAGHDDTIGGDVRYQLRRCALQNRVDCFQNAAGGFLKGLDHLRRGYCKHTGQAGHQAAALDFHGLLLGAGENTADGHLQLLRSPFTDQYIMLAPYVLDHGFIKLVARNLNRGGFHNTRQGDHRYVSGTAADVHHHMAIGLGDVNARANRGSQRLFDQIYPAGTRLNAGINDGTLFYLSNSRGNANHHAGLKKAEGGYLTDKLAQHSLGHIVVGDHTFTQGADGNNISGGTAQHLLSFGSHLQKLSGIFINRDHGGFTQNYTLPFDVYQDGGGTQVDSNILAEHSFSHLELLFNQFYQ